MERYSCNECDRVLYHWDNCRHVFQTYAVVLTEHSVTIINLMCLYPVFFCILILAPTSSTTLASSNGGISTEGQVSNQDDGVGQSDTQTGKHPQQKPTPIIVP